MINEFQLHKRFIEWTEFDHITEKRYLETLKRKLPENCYVIHTKYVKSNNLFLEIDFIVICPKKIFVVEHKDWGQKIVGNDREWRLYKDDGKPSKRKCPFNLIQKKQRIVNSLVERICQKNKLSKPLVTSLIVIGQEGDEIELKIEGDSKNITVSADDSINIFIKAGLNSTSLEKQIAEKIFKELSSTLVDLDLESLNIKKIEIYHDQILLNIYPSRKDHSKSFEIQVDIKEKTKNFTFNVIFNKQEYGNLFQDEIEALKERLKNFLNYLLENNTEISSEEKEIISDIIINWLKLIKKGKRFDLDELKPFVRLTNKKEVEKYLSGGFIDIGKDYHEFYKIFRKEIVPSRPQDYFTIIVGEIGSGKTTTLCRLAMDFIHKGKKVYLYQSNLPIPEEVMIQDSIIIVDNVAWINPKDLYKLWLLSVSRKNIVFGALREELLEIVMKNYLEKNNTETVPWRIFNLPKPPLNVIFETVESLEKDWGCYVPAPARPWFILRKQYNLYLISMLLKFPEIINKKLKFFEFETRKKITFSVPSYVYKFLRLIKDIKFLTGKSYETIIKTIYYSTIFSYPLNKYLIEFFYKELKLEHIIIDSLKKMLFNIDNHLWPYLWKDFFNLKIELSNKDVMYLFNFSPYPGEAYLFKEILNNIKIGEWKNEIISKFERKIKKILKEKTGKENKASLIKKLVLLSFTKILNDTEINSYNPFSKIQNYEELLSFIQDNNFSEEEVLDLIDFLIRLSYNHQNKLENNWTLNVIAYLFDFKMPTKENTLMNRYILYLRQFLDILKELKLDYKKYFDQEYIDLVIEWARKLNFSEIISSHAFKSLPLELFRIGLITKSNLRNIIVNWVNVYSGPIRDFYKAFITWYDVSYSINEREEDKIIQKILRFFLYVSWDILYSNEELKASNLLSKLMTKKHPKIAILILLMMFQIFEEQNPLTIDHLDNLSEALKIAKNNNLTYLSEVINIILLTNKIREHWFLIRKKNRLFQEALDQIVKGQKNGLRLMKKLNQSSLFEDERFIMANIKIIERLFFNKNNSSTQFLEKKTKEIQNLFKEKKFAEIIRLKEEIMQLKWNSQNDSNYLFFIWRTIGIAYRELGEFENALDAYLNSVAFSFDSSSIIPKIEIENVYGQIIGILGRTNQHLHYTIITLLFGRLLLPKLFISRIAPPKNYPALYRKKEKRNYILGLSDVTSLLSYASILIKEIGYATSFTEISLEEARILNDKEKELKLLIFLFKSWYEVDAEKANNYLFEANKICLQHHYYECKNIDAALPTPQLLLQEEYKQFFFKAIEQKEIKLTKELINHFLFLIDISPKDIIENQLFDYLKKMTMFLIEEREDKQALANHLLKTLIKSGEYSLAEKIIDEVINQKQTHSKIISISVIWIYLLYKYDIQNSIIIEFNKKNSCILKYNNYQFEILVEVLKQEIEKLLKWMIFELETYEFDIVEKRILETFSSAWIYSLIAKIYCEKNMKQRANRILKEAIKLFGKNNKEISILQCM